MRLSLSWLTKPIFAYNKIYVNGTLVYKHDVSGRNYTFKSYSILTMKNNKITFVMYKFWGPDDRFSEYILTIITIL